MGTDIHMCLINDKGDIIKDNLYDGRNYHWFDNITGRGHDSEYKHYPAYYGLPKDIKVPKKIEDDYSKDYYYDFYYMNLRDYLNWFNQYKPYIKAGYFTEYDKWQIEKKGYIPDEDEVITNIEVVEHPEIYTFMECIDIDKINEAIEDYYIIYYFDC